MPTINHDQVAINYTLQKIQGIGSSIFIYDDLIKELYGFPCDLCKSINYIMYDPSKIYIGEFKEEFRDSFIIYKSGIQNINKKANFNQRIQIFYNHHLIDRETYEKWYNSVF
jgi:hypothetical protein